KINKKANRDGNWTKGRLTYRLVEGLGGLDHVLVLLPRLLRLGEAELLDLLELMDAEDAPGVLAVSASLLPEARRRAGIPDGQILGLEPLLGVEGRDGLLGGGDEVLLIATLLADDGVEGLVEFLELGSAGHDLLVHEERGRERSVAL